MLNKTQLYYFSPTGGTKKVGEAFCKGISNQTVLVDLCKQGQAAAVLADALTVIAVPVFSGRIPSILPQRLSTINGAGQKAVTIVVYGNRAYEDALLELNDIIKKCGFRLVASGAFIAQHSMSAKVAHGRPDDKDKLEIADFAQKVLQKVDSGMTNEIKVPGNYPYRTVNLAQASPISLPACSLCQTCADVCPANAIVLENGALTTILEKCILCMACTAVCPEKARVLPPPLQERMEQLLGGLESVRRENESFL